MRCRSAPCASCCAGHCRRTCCCCCCSKRKRRCCMSCLHHPSASCLSCCECSSCHQRSRSSGSEACLPLRWTRCSAVSAPAAAMERRQTCLQTRAFEMRTPQRCDSAVATKLTARMAPTAQCASPPRATVPSALTLWRCDGAACGSAACPPACLPASLARFPNRHAEFQHTAGCGSTHFAGRAASVCCHAKTRRGVESRAPPLPFLN